MRTHRIVASFACALALVACRKQEVVEVTPSESSEPAPAPSAAKPVDHLADDELIAGGEDALGVKLPRVLSVTRRYGTEVHAEGTAPVAKVTAYFKSHTREGRVVMSAHATTIRDAKVPEKPGTVVNVEIENPIAESIHVRIFDASPAPAPTETTEAARRKAAGLSDDGKQLADPTHVE